MSIIQGNDTKRRNWRASVASETLTGVTQSKIGDVCLFIYVTGFAKRDLIAQNKKIELLVPRDSSILEH